MGTFAKAVVILFSAMLLLLIFTPGPVNSVAWSPPQDAGFSGRLAANDALKAATLIVSDAIYGPEDVAISDSGEIYAGMQDGRIVRVATNGNITTVADTGGRPLGLDWHPDGRLIVADAYGGLLSLSMDGEVSVLTRSADGVPFAFTDDVDVASDGRIYFSDASSRFNQAQYKLDLLEARPYGRLLVYDPADQSTRVLLDRLHFANGVALSQAEDFVLVNETWRYRIRRYWLEGPRAGENDVFVDNLPAFPDGISASGTGTFWLAMPSPRKASVDAMHAKPWLKNLVAKLPEFAQPAAVRYGLVAALNERGAIIGSLHDPSGEHLWEITSVEEYGGWLYFGSLTTDRIARLAVPAFR